MVEGDSAYNKRHQEHFKGQSIPYGCLDDVRPPSVVLKNAAKYIHTSAEDTAQL